MKKILTVVGARPQFVKAAPVTKAIKETMNLIEVMVHTGQHYDINMSETFFDDLEIPQPKYNLSVGSGSHGAQSGEIMKRLEPVLLEEHPDVVIIYGDTNSTLAAAVTAAKLHMTGAHIEAGLRSFNRSMPEEINRVVADHVSSFLFCPTTTGVQNLAKEGITKNVFNTGDVMYDVVLQFSHKAEEKSHILSDLRLENKAYILATVHRAENADSRKRLSNIFLALKEMSEETVVVVPLHPRTRNMIRRFELDHHLEGILLIEPVGFLDMLSLEKNARLIATDSGGVQKEAYFNRVPCVTLRDETEWVETIEAGWNVLAKVDSVEEMTNAMRRSLEFTGGRGKIDEYGDGRASMKIVRTLKSFLNI